MNSSPTTPSTYPYPDEPKWSKSEKAIAHRVFDAALEGELLEVMQKTKEMASQVKEPANLWKLERYLTQRRKDIDHRYEFRSSRLTRVFGMLLCEGRIREEDPRGLHEDKIKAILAYARLLSEDTA